MAIKVYQYPKCSTCRKAKKWLEAHDKEVQWIHIVDETPSLEVLRGLHERSGLPVRRLFNTSGGSYRGGNFKERLKTMNDAQALEALAADGMLIKRPIVDAGDVVLVGFKAERYEEALGQ